MRDEEPDLENQIKETPTNAVESTDSRGKLDYVRLKGGEAACAILPKTLYSRELGRSYVCTFSFFFFISFPNLFFVFDGQRSLFC